MDIEIVNIDGQPRAISLVDQPVGYRLVSSGRHHKANNGLMSARESARRDQAARRKLSRSQRKQQARQKFNTQQAEQKGWT